METQMDIILYVCCAGLRIENWKEFAHQIRRSCGKYKCSIIMCGPNEPDNNTRNVINEFIHSYESPTVCVQNAIFMAWEICSEPEMDGYPLITWLSDDADIIEDSIELAIDKWIEEKNYKTQIIMKYFEGTGKSGNINTQPEDYWRAHYHGSLRLPGVKPEYLTAPCGLMSLKYFIELGGFDCNFEHINMSCHDLSFRIQNDGGKVIPSPKYVMTCEFSHNIVNGVCNCILCEAYVKNDLPYFQSIYSNPEAINRKNISFNSYNNAEAVWRRFK